jgi:predicted RNA binding protein YcfA (HicA-like mRNA interferase family)
MKSMTTRQVVKALLRNKCSLAGTDGPHDKWTCKCGKHSTAVPRHAETSAGVVRNIIRDLACLPKGWLQ